MTLTVIRSYQEFDVMVWEYGNFSRFDVEKKASELKLQLPTHAQALILYEDLKKSNQGNNFGGYYWYWVNEPDHPDWGKIAYLIMPYLDHVRTDIWVAPTMILVKSKNERKDITNEIE